MPDPQGVELRLTARCVDDRVELEYALENRRAEPILVFDRGPIMDPLYTEEHPYGVPDPEWMHVEIPAGGWPSRRAILRRSLEPAGPPGSHAIVPYGRVLQPGVAVTELVRIPQPLREDAVDKGARVDPFRGGPQYESVRVSTVELRIGWLARVPNEHAAGYAERFAVGGEELLWFSRGANLGLNKVQQMATSPTVSVACDGLAYVPTH